MGENEGLYIGSLTALDPERIARVQELNGGVLYHLAVEAVHKGHTQPSQGHPGRYVRFAHVTGDRYVRVVIEWQRGPGPGEEGDEYLIRWWEGLDADERLYYQRNYQD